MDELFDAALASATTTLEKTYGEALAAGQQSLFDEATKPELVKTLSKDALAKLNQGDISGAVGGVAGGIAGAALCSATGVGATAAPLCAAVGAWVGQRLGPVVAAIGKSLAHSAGGTGGSDFGFPMDPQPVNEKRASILSALSLSGDDPLVAQEVRDLAWRLCPDGPTMIGSTADTYGEWAYKVGQKSVKGPLGMTITQPVYASPNVLVAEPLAAGYATFFTVAPWLLPGMFNAPGDAWLAWKFPDANDPSAHMQYREGWLPRLIHAYVAPFLKAGLPVQFIEDTALTMPFDGGTGNPDAFWPVRDYMAAQLIPELDKYTQARIQWLLEESTLRRNVRATQQVKTIRERMAAIHPGWSAAELDKAQGEVVRSIRSGDGELVAQVVQALSVPNVSASDVSEAISQGKTEELAAGAQEAAKGAPSSGGSGLLKIGMAGAGALALYFLLK